MMLKLLLSATLCTAVYADILTANDEQTCRELCSSCKGTASFVDGRCECYISDGNEKDDACMMRIKRQADDLGLNFVDCEAASGDRPPRCSSLLGASKRIRTSDADRIAKYFMNGGPIIGSSMLGAAKCDTDKILGAQNLQIGVTKCDTEVLGSPQEQPQPELPPEPIVAVSNPSCECLGAPVVQLASPSLGACYEAPEIVLGAPLGYYPVHSPPSYLRTSHFPVFRFPPHHFPSPLRSALPSTALRPHRHRHPLLGVPQVEEPEEHIVGAPKCYTPPSQMLKERPEILSSPGPIVQPGYTLSSQTRASQTPDVLNYFKNMLEQQNSILGAIHHHLQNSEVDLGSPYPLSEPNLGAPACSCSGQEMIQVPVLGCPKRIIEWMAPNKPRCPRMSPAVETLVEEGKNIEKVEEKEKEQVEEIKKMETVDETSERPKREPRPNVNGRKRKRELKKIVESQSL